jgi:aldehyde dehydrogenase (NAD+)
VQAAKALQNWRLTQCRAGAKFLGGAVVVGAQRRNFPFDDQEMGKILVETRGDVQEAIDMAYYGRRGRRLLGYIALLKCRIIRRRSAIRRA